MTDIGSFSLASDAILNLLVKSLNFLPFGCVDFLQLVQPQYLLYQDNLQS